MVKVVAPSSYTIAKKLQINEMVTEWKYSVQIPSMVTVPRVKYKKTMQSSTQYT